jgi:hypothetical protein
MTTLLEQGQFMYKHVNVTSLLWLLVTALFIESAKDTEKWHKNSPDSKLSTDALQWGLMPSSLLNSEMS